MEQDVESEVGERFAAGEGAWGVGSALDPPRWWLAVGTWADVVFYNAMTVMFLCDLADRGVAGVADVEVARAVRCQADGCVEGCGRSRAVG